MSRSLDIAKILSSTEINNPNNNRLFNSSEELGIDSSTYRDLALKYYTTLDSLPTSNLELGQRAFVNENRRLYISNGSGWYNALTNISATPYWVTEPASSYDIVDSATPLTITALAADSDNPNFINQSFASDSAQYMVNITNDSSVFTFTPKSADSIGIEVAAGNLTDSNGDFEYTFKWSDGTSSVQKTSTISYQPSAIFNWGGDRGVLLSGSITISSAPNGTYQHRVTSAETFSIPTGGSATAGSITYGQAGIPAVSNGPMILHGGGLSSSGSSPYPENFQYIQRFNPITRSNGGNFGTIANWGTATSVSGRQCGMASDGTNAFILGGYYFNQSTQSGFDTSGIHIKAFTTAGNTSSVAQLGSAKSHSGTFNNHEKAFHNGETVNMKTYAVASFSHPYPGGQRVDTASNLTYAIYLTSEGTQSNNQTCAKYNMTTGGSAVTQGTLAYGGGQGGGGNANNSDRAAFSGGRRIVSGTVYKDGSSQIEYFTFDTLGNATYLGATGENRYNMSGAGGDAA